MTITKTELAIMQYIWNLNREVTPKEIREHFSDKQWSKQTVSSFLKSLVNSGLLIKHKESMSKYYYSAAVSKKEYSLIPSKSVINDIFQGSSVNFFCALISPNEKIPEEELDRLEDLISQKRLLLQNSSNSSIEHQTQKSDTSK